MKRDYETDVKEEVEKKSGSRKEIESSRGNIVSPRRYHILDKERDKLRERFEEVTKDYSDEIKKLGGKNFFNPFKRTGIYYGTVQALYELGSNRWHSFKELYNETREIMSKIFDKDGISSWTKFYDRVPRRVNNIEVSSARDDCGRIEQNMKTLQRLGGAHPYAYKLRQVLASIDIKQEKNRESFYRLRTDYKEEKEVNPLWETKYKKSRIIKRTKTATIIK